MIIYLYLLNSDGLTQCFSFLYEVIVLNLSKGFAPVCVCACMHVLNNILACAMKILSTLFFSPNPSISPWSEEQ